MRIASLLLSFSVLVAGSLADCPLRTLARQSPQQSERPSDRVFLEAVEFRNTDLVRAMLARGANPNTRNFQGNSALMYAARNGDGEIVQALLAAGAAVNAQNNDGMDALFAATARGHRAIVTILKSAGANPNSERFVLEAQATGRRFEQLLRETRDFAQLDRELFAARFFDCHVGTMLEGKENGIFSQIGGSLRPEMAKQLTRDDLRHHLVRKLNFFHLKTLYSISRREWGSGQTAAIDDEEQEYPRAVFELLKKNPVAIRRSETLEELQASVTALEQAITLMREYLVAHPPEVAAAFSKNLERIGNNDYNSKFWEIDLWKLPEKDAAEAGKCIGQRVTRLIGMKVPPFYRLFFIEAGKDFKIGAMLCTEPPCAD